MRFNHKTSVLLSVVILSACSTQPRVITATPRPTSISTATAIAEHPTPTPIALADIELAELLIKDGDLPAGITGAQIRDDAGDNFSFMPLGMEQVAYQQFSNGDKAMGQVIVWLYVNPTDVIAGYISLSKKVGKSASTIPDVGEEAVGAAPDATQAAILGISPDLLLGEISFHRCQAVVYIGLPSGREGLPTVIAYAKRLDARLKDAICK